MCQARWLAVHSGFFFLLSIRHSSDANVKLLTLPIDISLLLHSRDFVGLVTLAGFVGHWADFCMIVKRCRNCALASVQTVRRKRFMQLHICLCGQRLVAAFMNRKDTVYR